MPTPVFGAANLQWVGVAPEITYGTAVAVPAYFLPCEAPVWTHPTDKLVDGALRGSMAVEYQQVNGMIYEQLSFKTMSYLDSVYYLFRAMLGVPDVLTGSVDPYTHKTSLQSGSNGQPQSSTLFWYDGNGKTRQMPGAQMSSLKISFKESGLVEIDVTFMSLLGAWITPPTNTPTTAQPMPGWNTQITVNSIALTKYSELDLDFKRASEAIKTITGTQAPFAIFAGPFAVSGSLTAIYEGSTDNQLVAELANTQQPLVVRTAPVGDAVHYLQIQMSKVAYDVADPTGTTKWMELKSTVKALANTTDVAAGGNLSPAIVTFLTPVSTAI
jgi:hypothetical protein